MKVFKRSGMILPEIEEMLGEAVFCRELVIRTLSACSMRMCLKRRMVFTVSSDGKRAWW